MPIYVKTRISNLPKAGTPGPYFLQRPTELSASPHWHRFKLVLVFLYPLDGTADIIVPADAGRLHLGIWE